MLQSKALSMLGMAQKAGKLASGEFSVEKSVKTQKSYLVLVASDASNNTREKFQNMCDFHGTPFRIGPTREEMGRAIGKEFRASVSILDENLARAVINCMESVSITE